MSTLSKHNGFRVRLDPEDTPASFQHLPAINLNYAYVLDALDQSLARMVVGIIKDIERLPENISDSQVKMLYKNEYDTLLKSAENGFLQLVETIEPNA